MSGMPDDQGVSSPLRAVIEVVVRALVDHPDAVKVTRVRRGINVLELRTAPGDMGKIIGRQGRTAAALRTLLAVTADRHGKKAQLDIKTDVQWDSMVLVGRIARPHGLRGQVVVNPETDFVEERFRPGERLWTRMDGREAALTIASARCRTAGR